MMENQQKHAWKDSAITMFASACVIILNIALTSLMSRFFIPKDFEDYLFARRFISAVFPITTLSIGAGLSWILARKISEPERVESELKGVVLLVVLFDSIVLLMALAMPFNFIQNYLFPSSLDGGLLWKVVLLWLFAYSGYVILYSYYRGVLNMRSANILNLIMNGVAPFAVFLFLLFARRLSPSLFLLLWAAALLLSFLPILRYCGNLLKDAFRSARMTFASSVPYSISRIPAGFLLNFPAFVLPFYMMKNGIETVYFLGALLVPQTLSFLTDPLAQVFLPRSANWNESGDMANLKKLAGDFLGLALHCGLVISAMLLVHGQSVARIWFGAGFSESGLCIQILAASVVPALAYPPLRSILDGIEKKPLITHFLMIVSVLTVLSAAFLRKAQMLDSASASMIVAGGYYILFFMILFAIFARIGRFDAFPVLSQSIIVAAICGMTGYAFEKILGGNTFFSSLTALLANAFACVFINLCWLEKQKPSWWLILKDTLAGFRP